MIYYKLDWYCVMLYNQSISFVLKKLNIDPDLILEAYQQKYFFNIASSNKFCLDFDGVRIQVDRFQVLQILADHDNDPRSLLDEIYDDIRVEITGSGLTTLRANGVGPDQNFALIDFWGEDPRVFNVKRVDFAFDFINCNESYLDSLIDYAHSIAFEQGRLHNGMRSGVKYSYKVSHNYKCFYVGSSQSDIMLRIYDKLLEQSKHGVLKNPLPDAFVQNEPDGIVNSWTRFEVQTRDEWAYKLLFQPQEALNSLRSHDDILPWSGCIGDYTYVLRMIIDRYSFYDTDGQILPFVSDLISSFDDLPALVPIFYYAQSVKSVYNKAYSYLIDSFFPSLYFLIAVHGFEGFIDIIKNFEHEMNTNSNTYWVLKKISCSKKIDSHMYQSGDTLSDLHLDVSPTGSFKLLD